MIRLGLLTLLFSPGALFCAAQETPAQTRVIGTVTAIHGNTISIKSDTGTETSVSIGDSTRMVRTAPGQKDLKEATPITLEDVQVGDRALVRGTTGGNNALVAASVIVMKQTDVASRQQQEMQEWQRHGAGGIVREVDPATGAIKISAGPNQSLRVQTSASTEFLRYAADSI